MASKSKFDSTTLVRASIGMISSLALVFGFATPAATATKYVAVQKTLSPFSSSATSLTSTQRAEVRRVVEANPDAEKFICTGIRYFSQPMSENIKVRARAKAACEFAKELNPNLSTWFQNKPTQARSYAGKVLLTLKVPESTGTAAERSGGNQAGFATGGPETWLNSTAKKPGGLCTVEGAREFPRGATPLECRRVTLATLRWVASGDLKPRGTKPNVANPKDGSVCYRQGERIANAGGFLECRYVGGMKLQFVQLTGSNDAPVTAAGLASVEMCKMRDQRPVLGGGGSTAFPMQYNRVQTNGTLDIAIVPIDFPDSPAPGKPEDLIIEHIEMLNQRNKDLYGERFQIRWHIPDQWLRMSKEAKYYNQDHETVQPDGSRKKDGTRTLLTADEQLSEIYTAAEKVLDIAAMDYFFTYSNPYEPDVQFGPGYINDIKTATRTYRGVSSYPLGFWAFNAHQPLLGIPMFDWFAHELGHAQGIVQHAPANGTQWYYGVNTTWEAWVAGWRPDSEYACLDATKSVDAEIALSSMDLPSSGYKSIVIKVSPTEVLVVESRRKGLYNIAFPVGFAGIAVYNVDATKTGDRWDGDLSREKDYYAYFLRNNRGTYPVNPPGPNLGDENVIGYEGDSFTYRGITVTLTDSGDYDTVTIKSANGATPLSQDDEQKFVITQTFGREPEGTPGFCGCCGCFPGAKTH